MPALRQLRQLGFARRGERAHQLWVAGGDDLVGGVAVEHQLGVVALAQQHPQIGQLAIREVGQLQARDVVHRLDVVEVEEGAFSVLAGGDGEVDVEVPVAVLGGLLGRRMPELHVMGGRAPQHQLIEGDIQLLVCLMRPMRCRVHRREIVP